MSVLSFLATVFGSAMALANYPQAFRIFKRKSAGDISILTYSILFVGAIVWVLYGIEIQSSPIIISNALGTTGVFLTIMGWHRYGRR